MLELSLSLSVVGIGISGLIIFAATTKDADGSTARPSVQQADTTVDVEEITTRGHQWQGGGPRTPLVVDLSAPPIDRHSFVNTYSVYINNNQLRPSFLRLPDLPSIYVCQTV